MDSLAGEMVGSATKMTESIVSGRDRHVAYLQNRRSMILARLRAPSGCRMPFGAPLSHGGVWRRRAP
jgi:hypothetical protein